MIKEKRSSPPPFLNQVVIYGLGLALNYGIGFILLPIYSRLMPASQYGILEIINRTIEIVSLLLLTQYAITFLRFYREKKEEEYRRLVTSTCIYLVLVVASVFSGAMALFREELSLLLFNPADCANCSYYMGLAAAKYFVTTMFIVPFIYFQAREEPGKYVAVSVTHFTTVVGLNIFLLSVMDDKVAAVLYAGIIGPLCFLLTVGVWVFSRSARRFDFGIAKQIVGFAWSFTFVGAFGFIITNGDRYFLNKFCNPEQTGLYAFGYKIGMMLNSFVFSPIIRAWNAKMVDVMRRIDGSRYLARLVTYALLLYTTMALTLSIYSREFIGTLMGKDYYQSYRVIPLIALCYAFTGMSLFFDTGIYITKKTYLKMWHLVTTLVCLALYYLLIPSYCMMGAAWASVGTYLTLAFVGWFVNQRAMPTSYEYVKLVKILLPAIALYLVNLQLENWQVEHLSHLSIAASTINPLLYTIVILAAKLPLLLFYLLSVWMLRILEPDDYNRIQQYYNDMKGKLSWRTASKDNTSL